MELTVEVRREENGHYTAAILGPQRSGLTGIITETRALGELGDHLEDAIRLVRDAPDLRLDVNPLRLGTQLVTISAETVAPAD